MYLYRVDILLALREVIIQPLHGVENFFPSDVLISVLETERRIALTIGGKDVMNYNSIFMHSINDPVSLTRICFSVLL